MHGSLEETSTFLKIPKKCGLAIFFLYICSCQNESPSKVSKGPFLENAGKLFPVKSTNFCIDLTLTVLIYLIFFLSKILIIIQNCILFEDYDAKFATPATLFIQKYLTFRYWEGGGIPPPYTRFSIAQKVGNQDNLFIFSDF